MGEEKELSRHEQLKYRLRNRISKELFESMPEEIQEYLVELDPADVKEAYLTTLLKLPWQAQNKIPSIELPLAKKLLDNEKILGVLNLNNMITILDKNVKVLKYKDIEEYRSFCNENGGTATRQIYIKTNKLNN